MNFTCNSQLFDIVKLLLAFIFTIMNGRISSASFHNSLKSILDSAGLTGTPCVSSAVQPLSVVNYYKLTRTCWIPWLQTHTGTCKDLILSSARSASFEEINEVVLPFQEAHWHQGQRIKAREKNKNRNRNCRRKRRLHKNKRSWHCKHQDSFFLHSEGQIK